jgi:hypothetical protein
VRYAAAGDPNQVVSASVRSGWVRSPTQATYPSGRINTAVGADTKPSVALEWKRRSKRSAIGQPRRKLATITRDNPEGQAPQLNRKRYLPALMGYSKFLFATRV